MKSAKESSLSFSFSDMLNEARDKVKQEVSDINVGKWHVRQQRLQEVIWKIL